ncbi:PepSY domain-containing protein [Diaphorobacter sp.]|uniref:PepSY domain-containing protein n=1 Tax=Diaphorobacter sp. TaxID=1934310 RepID=UPI0028A5ACF1|nr:PepSY domain-containing protein [Diaphorobacter sp.]
MFKQHPIFSQNNAGRVAASLALAAALAGIGGIASAQMVPQPVAPSAVPQVTPVLDIGQIFNKVQAAGYRDVREIEWDDGRYEVKASDAQGKRLKLYVNASTGAVEHVKSR